MNTRFLFAISTLLSISLSNTACVEDQLLPIAPCEIILSLTPPPDTCFNLPLTPSGERYTTPPVEGRQFYFPITYAEDEVLYYVNTYADDLTIESKTIHKVNICTGSDNTFDDVSNYFWAIPNSDGELLVKETFLSPISLVEGPDDEPTQVTPVGEYIGASWINQDSFVALRFEPAEQEYRSILFDQSGGSETPLPFNALFTGLGFNNKILLYFSSTQLEEQGYLATYNLLSQEVELLVDIRAQFGGIGDVEWVTADLIVGTSEAGVFSYNISTSTTDLLVDASCENLTYRSIEKLDGRDHEVLLSRLDYIYNDQNEYHRQFRISLLDLNTLEEQILEIE